MPKGLDISDKAAAELEGQFFAAADLGSNSFHMVVARFSAGSLQVRDRLRQPVRLGAGLTADGGLDGDVRDRALACLSRFGERLRDINASRVRVVATNTVRQLRNPQSFLLLAETALGHSIEVISGREEARLTHLGVAHAMPDRDKRLVIDIGGGSTEFVIGQKFEALETESVQMGCVVSTKRYFEDGKITRRRWQEVNERLMVEVSPFRQTFLQRGWKTVVGTSGTLKSTAKILGELGSPPGLIQRAGLKALVDRVIRAGERSKLKLPGLSDDRAPVFAGGLAIVDAIFDALKLDTIQVSEVALREGVLYDLIGRITRSDPRLASVRALAKRCSVDTEHAARVEQTALALFDAIAKDLKLGDSDRETLRFAALIHEAGLAIAHSQHHQHGAYIVEHSDLPGFAREEQTVLAALVRCHRRAPPDQPYAGLTPRAATCIRKLLPLLRLAVVLERARRPDSIAGVRLSVDGKALKLKFPIGWLDAHPLTRADLKDERQHLEKLGTSLKLRLVSAVHKGIDPLTL